MSSSSLLGLPSIPAELKPALPYLQRAEELKKQDAIVSYWCAYYAAQIGIGIKARDAQARDVLFQLLGVLEKMKANIGPHDAVDMEAVSSAYVENFALRVFSNADNEDRSGRATRSTAKKFLAAANFLEVLKIFPKADVSESNDEKIRYAKWKAADIAKAFRDGVQPVPGPPGWAEEQEELKRLNREKESASIPAPPRLPPSNSSESTLISSSPPKPSVKRGSPPRTSHMPSSSPSKHSNFPKPSPSWAERPAETWSNAATPGTDTPDAFITPTHQPRQRTTSSASRSSHKKQRSGSSTHTIDAFTGSARGSLKQPAWTNEELETPPPSSSPKKSAFKSGSPDSDKRVRFSPPTEGHVPSAASPPKSASPPREYTGPESIYAPSRISPPTGVSPSNSLTGHPTTVPPPSASSPGAYIYAQSPPPNVSPTRNVYASVPPLTPPPPPAPVAPPFELTPKIVSKAQKHCRYAISALDYEDVETARKELREALKMLGP